MKDEETPLNGYIRVNGIRYDCHEEIEILFRHLFRANLLSAERCHEVEMEIRDLRLELKRREIYDRQN